MRFEFLPSAFRCHARCTQVYFWVGWQAARCAMVYWRCGARIVQVYKRLKDIFSAKVVKSDNSKI
jgi:hypothetical protein